MKKILTAFLSVLLFSAILPISSNAQTAKLKFHFATLKEGRKIISKSDAFTKSLHHFDLVSRLQEAGMEPTEKNYLKLGKQSVLEWTEIEKKNITESAAYLQKFIDSCGYDLPIPEDITLIKTSMVEEGRAAGYTRGTNIFLTSCEKLTPKGKLFLNHLLAHELFHVLTRNCPEFREAMYAQIGFKILDKDIEFSDEMLELRITNPDVNRYDNYSVFTINGKKVPCTMWFRKIKEYAGGAFFMYGAPGLVPLDANFKPVVKEDGSPIIYDITEAEDFYSLIGKNTSYVINPEEALADNFAFALIDYFLEGNPSPEVTERLRNVMKGSWRK